MSEKELPELPDGWRWVVDALEQPRAVTGDISVALIYDRISVVVSERTDWVLVKAEVIIAVLRANGYNFTS